MKKYKYKHELFWGSHFTESPQFVTERLNKLGQEGWGLCGIITHAGDSGCHTLVFKREVSK